MYCKYCKANNIKGNIYCFSCGAKLPVLKPTPSTSFSVSEERSASEYDNAVNWKRVGYWASVIIAGAAPAIIMFLVAVHVL